MIVIWCLYTKLTNYLLLNFNKLIYEPIYVYINIKPLGNTQSLFWRRGSAFCPWSPSWVLPRGSSDKLNFPTGHSFPYEEATQLSR